MQIAWLCFLTFMIVAWVVLDGYVFGTGIIYLGVAKSNAERRQVLQTVLPLWDGDEVWLIAAGGASVFSFPGFYASAFSGFYLAFMVLLWLLMMRGFALELRDHVRKRMWHVFWDWTLTLASFVATFFLGVALGNMLRGVPLGKSGYFLLPLWTDLSLGPNPGIFDWYTALIGFWVVLAIGLHGSLWVAFRTDGPPRARALRLARRFWPAAVTATIVNSALTFGVRPQIAENFARHPWGVFFPAAAVSGLAAAAVFAWSDRPFLAFNASSVYLFGMVGSVAFGLFPFLLPAYRTGDGLTIYNTASSDYAQRVAVAWFIPGILLVLGYSAYAHLRNVGTVRLRGDEPEVVLPGHEESYETGGQ